MIHDNTTQPTQDGQAQPDSFQMRALREWASLNFPNRLMEEKDALCQWVANKPLKQWRRCKAIAEVYFCKWSTNKLEQEYHFIVEGEY